MAFGVNAWDIANPVLSNVSPTLLETYDVVDGDSEISFGLSDKYKKHTVTFEDLYMNAAGAGLDVTLSIAGVYIGGASYNYYSIGSAIVTGAAFMRTKPNISNFPFSSIGEIGLYQGIAGATTTIMVYAISTGTGTGLREIGGAEFTNVNLVDGIKLISAGGATTFKSGKFRLFGVPNN